MLRDLLKRLADLDVTIKWVDPNKIVFIQNATQMYIAFDYNEDDFVNSPDNFVMSLYIEPMLQTFEKELFEVGCGPCGD